MKELYQPNPPIMLKLIYLIPIACLFFPLFLKAQEWNAETDQRTKYRIEYVVEEGDNLVWRSGYMIDQQIVSYEPYEFRDCNYKLLDWNTLLHWQRIKVTTTRKKCEASFFKYKRVIVEYVRGYDVEKQVGYELIDGRFFLPKDNRIHYLDPNEHNQRMPYEFLEADAKVVEVKRYDCSSNKK